MMQDAEIGALLQQSIQLHHELIKMAEGGAILTQGDVELRLFSGMGK